jgi:hypothetical protein
MKSFILRTAGIFLIFASFTSCTKSPQSGNIKELDKYYTSAIIDGKKIEFTENQNGYLNGYGKAGVWVDGMSQWFERQSTTYAKNGENIFNIYFMKFVNSNPPTKNEIKSIFHQGTYSYGSSDFYNLVDGVEIRYIDENGMEWTTKGDQTGSLFQVNSHTTNISDSYTPFVTEGNFTCKLYNNLGQSKLLTEGIFKGRTVVYY